MYLLFRKFRTTRISWNSAKEGLQCLSSDKAVLSSARKLPNIWIFSITLERRSRFRQRIVLFYVIVYTTSVYTWNSLLKTHLVSIALIFYSGNGLNIFLDHPASRNQGGKPWSRSFVSFLIVLEKRMMFQFISSLCILSFPCVYKTCNMDLITKSITNSTRCIKRVLSCKSYLLQIENKHQYSLMKTTMAFQKVGADILMHFILLVLICISLKRNVPYLYPSKSAYLI